MPIITFNGPIGAGGNEIGQLVAQTLDLDYVDRAILAEAARVVKSPVGALVEKEQRVIRFRERLGRFLQTMLERSAIASASGEPYFGRGIEMLPAESYPELAGDPASAVQVLNDKAYIEATTAVVKDLARSNNVVIIGRGANMILGDAPGVIHVGVLAPREFRVETIMQREHLDRAQAEAYVDEVEQARVNFFRKFFKVNVYDPNLYHVMLNMGKMKVKTAAEIVIHAAGDLAT
jgi:cytidylate kinase